MVTTPQQVLDCPMGQNDADAQTVREYLLALLLAIWSEGEGFSGKRPFGNSGWEYEVYTALGKAGLLEVRFDGDGYIDYVDDSTGDRLVRLAIESLR